MRRQRTLIRLSVVLAALTLAWACGDGDSVTAPVELCVPADASFQAWLNTISSHEGTGVECAPLTDREILKVLYAATDGSGWIDSDNWLTDAALRDWHGVEVDVQGRVTRLRLDENDLTGPIPSELGNLANLTRLYLDDNDLTGPIPSELGNLANLTRLYLDDNDLTGPIPSELGNLANLTRLYLDENDLTGPIPSELGNLANLTRLYLDDNDLTGPIPPELGNLANLTRLRLNENNLTGPIPPELSNLANLTWLYLYGNDLSGPIPSELGNLANLLRLDLAGNGFGGPLPAELGSLGNLELLYLGHNDLEGPVPAEFGALDAAAGTRPLGQHGHIRHPSGQPHQPRVSAIALHNRHGPLCALRRRLPRMAAAPAQPAGEALPKASQHSRISSRPSSHGSFRSLSLPLRKHFCASSSPPPAPTIRAFPLYGPRSTSTARSPTWPRFRGSGDRSRPMSTKDLWQHRPTG